MPMNSLLAGDKVKVGGMPDKYPVGDEGPDAKTLLP
jgi:hypothetical protein